MRYALFKSHVPRLQRADKFRVLSKKRNSSKPEINSFIFYDPNLKKNREGNEF
jgi:hypothetical protein